MRYVCLFAAFLAVGCGASDPGSSSNNIMAQGGQWEYVVVPNNGAGPMYFDANLPSTSAGYKGNTVVEVESRPVVTPALPGPTFCTGYVLDGTISGSNLKGQLVAGATTKFADFSGELSANGQNVSSGKYAGKMCGDDNGPDVNGTFTGYTVPPINGTFKGTLNSSLYGNTDAVTVSIIQNPDFTVNALGTAVEDGVTTSLASNNSSMNGNLVTGAVICFGGTETNVNGSTSFSLCGHANPNATQLTVLIGRNGESVTGVLTKQ